MGITFSKLFARLFSKKEMRILMVSSAVHRPACLLPYASSFVELWVACTGRHGRTSCRTRAVPQLMRS